MLNEVDKYGDNVLTPREEKNSITLPIEREKPVLAINTSNTTKMANTDDNTSTGGSTPPIATPDSAPQSLTVKIKLVSHGGDGVAIRIPYHYSPLLSLVEDENGACSVSIACPSLELSVSPTQFYAPPAQVPYSGTKSLDDRIVTLSSRNTSNSRLTSPSKDDHICQCTCLLQEKTELKTTITTTEIEGPWISQQVCTYRVYHALIIYYDVYTHSQLTQNSLISLLPLKLKVKMEITYGADINYKKRGTEIRQRIPYMTTFVFHMTETRGMRECRSKE